MLDRERSSAIRLAREAGKILTEIYATDFDVEFKGKADPVTEADRRANEYLVTEIRRLFPGDGIVAEESEDRSDGLLAGRCWYVDPLDGTKEFIAKNGEFSVMIGLAIDGEARLGVVFQPSKNKLYHGVVGDGAMVEGPEGSTAMRVSSVPEPAHLKLVVSRSHRSESMDRVVRGLGIAEERRSGSVGLKIGLIAEQE
ncbi:MAG: 3'(2'),5'-bisphosphate nucleotidase CysQ, partial [Myxococcales bacterium]|nr:3'(2'),5'-bisphosphate nucleotidase CysQ [Myxococcales bacterium]